MFRLISYCCSGGRHVPDVGKTKFIFNYRILNNVCIGKSVIGLCSTLYLQYLKNKTDKARYFPKLNREQYLL